MKINRFILNITTLGPIGYLPASGTIATILTLPIIYLFSFYKQTNYLILTLFFTVFAYFLINSIYKFLKKDPPEIVIDELIGCLFTFLAIKINFQTLLCGFILFRIFDITKPFGIKKIEKLNGASGILFDDITAGLISNFLLRLFA